MEGSEKPRAPRWVKLGLGIGAVMLFLVGLSVGFLLKEALLGVLLFALGAILFSLRGYLETGDKVLAGALIFDLSLEVTRSDGGSGSSLLAYRICALDHAP